MIRVMNIDIGDTLHRSPSCLQEYVDPLHQADVDILCCQSIRHPMGGGKGSTRVVMEALGLTCSCFAPIHPQKKIKESTSCDLDGLAIMTGPDIWMLNSGSFQVPGEQGGEEGVAQFAHIRKGMASILLINLQFATSEEAQAGQVRALFAHQLLKERYSAVLLCGDRPLALHTAVLQAITGKTHYMPYRKANGGSGNGIEKERMQLFVARQEEYAIQFSRLEHSGMQKETVPRWPLSRLGCGIDLEFTRLTQHKRPFLPLSFREQWLGCKEHYRAFSF